MEHAEIVNKEIGENNLNLLFYEFREGKINKQTLQYIALQMKGGVHGVFKSNEDRTDLALVDLFRKLLDQWYLDHLHKEDINCYDELVRILSNPYVGLDYLVANMKRETQKQNVILVDNPFDQEMNNYKPRNKVEIELTCSQCGPLNKDYQPDSSADVSNKPLPQKQRCDSKLESGNTESKPAKHCNKWLKFCFIFFLGVGVGRLAGETSIQNVVVEYVTPNVPKGNVNSSASETTQSDLIPEPVDTTIQQPNCTSNDTNHKEQISRSFKVKKGKFTEFHSCKVAQNNIPDLPGELVDVVGIFTEKLGLLVCGGLDVGDDPTPDHPRKCHTHVLGSGRWEEFEHRLNTNRRGSNMKISGNKIYIIGGHSSDPILDCYPSLEVLDLHILSEGWKEEESLGECFTDQIIEVPCI